MKQLLTLALTLATLSICAQAPELMSFQSVARNSDGSVVSAVEIDISVSISSDINGNSTLYSESHATSTNDYGVFGIKVGDGSSKSGSLSDVDWTSGNKFLRVSFRRGDEDFSSPVVQQLLTVPYAFLAKDVLNKNDDDADSTNELQTLTFSDSLLSISAGNTVDISSLKDGFEANTDDQELTLTELSLSIEDGNSVDLSAVQDGFEANTDDQQLSLTGATLSIEDGNAIDLSVLGANTDEQSIDEFALASTTLSLSLENDGETAKTVELASFMDNTDNQTIDEFNLVGSDVSLSIAGDGEEAKTINLGAFLDNSDDQQLSLTGTTLAIEDGNSVELASLQDGYEANTDNQTIDQFDLTGNNVSLSLTGDGEAAKTISLSAYLDNTDNQQLSFSSNQLSLENGGSAIDLGGYLDNSDDQTIDNFYISDNIIGISLEDDGESAVTIDVGSLFDNTDNQNLTLTGSNLSIGGGNTVGLSGFLDNTDDQVLSFSTNTLSLEDGGAGIDLSGYLDNTDDQALSLSGNSLSLEDGGTAIDLSGFLDNTDDQVLSLSGNSLSLEDGGTAIDLAGYLDNTDDQTIDLFAISSNFLRLSLEDDGETPQTVNLAGYLDNTDGQTLSFSGTSLSISGGNSVNLSSLTSSSGSFVRSQVTTVFRAATLDVEGNNFKVGSRINFTNIKSDAQGEFDLDEDFFRASSDGFFQVNWNFQLESIEGTVGYIYAVVKESGSTTTVEYINKGFGIALGAPTTETGSVLVELSGGDELSFYLIETGTGVEIDSGAFGGTILDDGTYDSNPGSNADGRANFVQIVQIH